MNLFTFIFCTIIAAVRSQYYYIDQPAVYYNPPTTYNAFSPFSTYHVNPQFQYRAPAASLPPPRAPEPVHRSAFVQNDADYRGFAYQTRTDNGATSHVLFVTGPQAQQANSRIFNSYNTPHVTNTRIFSNFNSPQVNSKSNQARTVASEMVDHVKKTEEKLDVLPKNIQDLYSPPAQNNDPFQFLETFFQGTQLGSRLVNFYSRNNDLFTDQVPGYPANVAPLPQNVISPRFLNLDAKNITAEITTEKANDKKSEVEEVAESIVTNTRFRINVVDENDDYSVTESKTSTTTEAPDSSTDLDNISLLSPTVQQNFLQVSSDTLKESSTEITSTTQQITEISTAYTTPDSTTSTFVTLSEVAGRLYRKNNQSEILEPTDSSEESEDLQVSTYSSNESTQQVTTSPPKIEDSTPFMIIVNEDQDFTAENATNENTTGNILITTEYTMTTS